MFRPPKIHSHLPKYQQAKQEKEAHGKVKTDQPVYLGAQVTYNLGTIKGVCRIYQQTFIDI